MSVRIGVVPDWGAYAYLVRRPQAIAAALLLSVLTPPPRLLAAVCTPVRLDLASVTQLAAQRNLTIRAAQQDVCTAAQVKAQAVGASRGRADLGASYYQLSDPVALLSRTVIVDGSELTIPGQIVANENPYFANLNARFPIYTSGRLRYDIRHASFAVEEARNSADDVQLTTVLQVTRIYLAAVYGRENVRLNEESLKSYQEHLAQARGMLKEGVATGYDVTRAEAAVADQEMRLTEVRNQYAQALDNLRTALALDACTTIDLQGSFFDLPIGTPAGEAEQVAVRNDPLLMSLCDRSNGLLMAEKAIRAEGRPQVDLVAFANLVSRDKGFLTSAQWSVGAQLSQAIFDGGVIRARAGERRSEREKTDLQYAARGDDVRLAVRTAYLDMDTARSAIAAGTKSVELARESLRLANRRYQEGVGTSLEVLDANINLLAAETAWQRAWYELDSAYLGARRYLGDLLQVAQSAQGTGIVSREGGIR